MKTLFDTSMLVAAHLPTHQDYAVDHLLTLNVADFQRVWPAGAARVVSPHSLSPP